MPSFRSSTIPFSAFVLFAAIVLTGCATSRLSAEIPQGERLAGDWKLDAARSDDLGKAVAELRAQMAKARHDSRRDSDNGEPQQGPRIGPAPRASPVDELMSSVPRGDYLRIAVSGGSFTVISGDSSDEYTPGLESEISAQQGDAQQISGWKAADYVIDTRPQWGAEIIQSYSLTKDGKLAVTVRLTGGKINFKLTRVYDRTTRVAPLAPPTNN
ncbi:MAG: hypothetical protein ACRET5_18125 [Steroidobacteraceae bacterium]